MRCWGPVLAVALVAAVAPARGECLGAGSDRDVLAAEICGDASPSGGWVSAGLHAGSGDAFHRISGDASGLEVTNLPGIADRLRLTPQGPVLEDSELFGPTMIESSLGTGGLTAGLTPTGVIATLAWPNPSTINQTQFLSRNRTLDRGGAAENQGVFAGIDEALPGGGRTFSWLRDWPASQAYSSGALVTTFARDGVTVRQTAVVSPRSDVLAIRFEVTGARDAKIVFFENLNPALHKVPWAPAQDNLLWQASDFAAAFDGSSVIHFRPVNPDASKFLNVVQNNPDHAAETLARDLDETFDSGVAFAITSHPAPVAHQIGVDAAGLLRSGLPDVGGLDAFYDATANGAALSGASIALGQVTAAIAVPASGGVADVIVAADHRVRAARAAAMAARFAPILDADADYWSDWLAAAALPAASGDLAADERALIAIRNGMARDSGAIVASIARQSPYAEDWTRDGAFFNFALELAGHSELVEQHNRFYARVQRPNGTWGTMYYADGVEGGPYLYEIDQQALATWTLWQHFVDHPSKAAYLAEVYPAIARSAEWLVAYTNPVTGRQLPAMEDDSIFASDGLQGAGTVWLALRSAAKAAGVMNDLAAAARWEARAGTLKDSILTEYFPGGVFNPGSPGYGQHFLYRGDAGAAAWLIWPVGLLDPSLPEERAMLSSLAAWLYDYEEPRIPLAPGAPAASILSYDQKAIGALAVFLNMGLSLGAEQDPAKVAAWNRFYHTALPTPTLHYGEQIWNRGAAGWRNVVDMPHIWTGALVYLQAMAIERPDLVGYRPWDAL